MHGGELMNSIFSAVFCGITHFRWLPVLKLMVIGYLVPLSRWYFDDYYGYRYNGW